MREQLSRIFVLVSVLMALELLVPATSFRLVTPTSLSRTRHPSRSSSSTTTTLASQTSSSTTDSQTAADSWLSKRLEEQACRDAVVRGPKQVLVYDTTLRGTLRFID